MSRFPKRSFAQKSCAFKTIGLSMLVVSLLALLLAPTQMPASYSWLRHTTSESAAQGIEGAWLARLGFLIFGLTVIWLAGALVEQWSLPVRLLHGAFGVLMVATAAFSTRPWLSNAPYDPVEDAFHSFTASTMGVAFATGVLLRLLQRKRDPWGRRIDLLAAVAAVAIPLAMNALPEWDGLLQRGMFTIAYIWYGLALLNLRPAIDDGHSPLPGLPGRLVGD